MKDSKKLERALEKKAFGYDAEEVVEEYVSEDGEMKLVRRKVTKKNVAPDVTALKMLLDGEKSLAEMTDEELAAEKERLLKMLAKQEKEEEN